MTSPDQPHDDATTRFWSRYRAAGSSGAGSRPDEPPEAGVPGQSSGQADPGPSPGPGDPGSAFGQADRGPSPGPGDPGRSYAQGEPGAGHRDEDRCLDWCPICRGAERLEAAIPPELADQLRLVQRDALLLARAAIDAHLARSDDREPRSEDRGDRGGPEPPPPSGEDIPIE